MRSGTINVQELKPRRGKTPPNSCIDVAQRAANYRQHTLIGTSCTIGYCIAIVEHSIMRNQTPLVPGQPTFDVTVHIVLNYFGSRLGRAYCETGEDEADEETIIENILNGQY